MSTETTNRVKAMRAGRRIVTPEPVTKPAAPRLAPPIEPPSKADRLARKERLKEQAFRARAAQNMAFKMLALKYNSEYLEALAGFRAELDAERGELPPGAPNRRDGGQS